MCGDFTQQKKEGSAGLPSSAIEKRNLEIMSSNNDVITAVRGQ